ncbi:MAG: type II 3-dehydroquinate dehydratase [Muribaculaceae bacterium]|nr:type II 3-dehydroquinate dehydratase [Muribaculaceae bacterium]
MKVLILNGPNLNLVGKREPEIYGDVTIDSYIDEFLRPLSKQLRTQSGDIVEVSVFQSNSEGEIVTRIQDACYGSAKQRVDAIILNAGAYSHYSLAIVDAIRAITVPVYEVHLSNIYAREEVRRHSVISAVCAGVIAGFGMEGYSMALLAAVRRGEMYNTQNERRND